MKHVNFIGLLLYGKSQVSIGISINLKNLSVVSYVLGIKMQRSVQRITNPLDRNLSILNYQNLISR